jgi:hyperosmotically inducible protein
MVRALLRAVLLIVVLVAVGAFLLGWWGSGRVGDEAPRETVGTAGEVPKVDTSRAREVGAQVGEKTAEAANQAQRALTDGSVTAKIKAKMALDESVKALDVDVDTTGGIVTVSGTVATEAQRQRALQLARETAGVTQVVDRLQVRR